MTSPLVAKKLPMLAISKIVSMLQSFCQFLEIITLGDVMSRVVQGIVKIDTYEIGYCNTLPLWGDNNLVIAILGALL